jgi:hypothetical protein
MRCKRTGRIRRVESLIPLNGGHMSKRVLLLGLSPDLMAAFRQQLDTADLELLAGNDVDDVRAAFAQGDIDHVILGGGLDLSTRLDAVREVFQSSDKATVHMKDHRSGPDGYVPFAVAVLQGLSGYEPRESAQAILRADRAD